MGEKKKEIPGNNTVMHKDILDTKCTYLFYSHISSTTSETLTRSCHASSPNLQWLTGSR